MDRRRFLLASVAAALVPAIARAQTTTGECTVGFVNGILQFDPNCSTLSVPGLPMSVSPPSHLVGAVDDGSTSSTNTVQAERIELLQRHRSKKRRKQNRQAGKRDNRHTQRARKRGQRRFPTSATVSGNKAHLSSSFELEHGLYVATATIVASNVPGSFVATLMGPSGFANKVFSLTPSSSGTHTFQATVDLPEDGSYLWDVTSADGKWTLTLSMA